MARHSTQNGQKYCDSHSPFKSTAHKRVQYTFPCSMTFTKFAQIERRRAPGRVAGLEYPNEGENGGLPSGRGGPQTESDRHRASPEPLGDVNAIAWDACALALQDDAAVQHRAHTFSILGVNVHPSVSFSKHCARTHRVAATGEPHATAPHPPAPRMVTCERSRVWCWMMRCQHKRHPT